MLRNYLKVAWRNLARNKGHAAINILGLAAGMALVVLILLYVVNELSYDRFHRHADCVYRLETDACAVMPPAVRRALLDNIPGIEHCVRLDLMDNRLLSHGQDGFMLRHFVFADAAVLDVFTLPLAAGDARTALTEPFSLVLSQDLARRMFGDDNPVGQTVRYQDRYDFRVSGVFQAIPNFHLELDAVASFASLEQADRKYYDEQFQDDWAYATYVRLHPQRRAGETAAAITRFFKLKRVWDTPNIFRLRPLRDIYFHGGEVSGAKGVYGNLALVIVFATIGGFILLLAGANFINLATARAALRAREVGIRKTLGGERRGLVFQFLVESCLVSTVAAGLALLLVYALLPLLEYLAACRIGPADWLNPVWLLGVMAGALVIGLLAGFYPAWYLASFQPLAVLKGDKVRGRQAAALRKGLLVFQFCISIALIIGTLTVLRQLHYMRSMAPDFSRKQIIHTSLNPVLYAAKDVLKEKLLAVPGVLQVAYSCRVPGQEWWVWGIGDRESGTFTVNSIDPDYLDLMGLTLLQGRNFSWQHSSDRWQDDAGGRQALIMNETAARRLGLTAPVPVIGGASRYRNDSLIGIVEDFHYYSPHTRIEPLILYWAPGVQRSISIKIATADASTTIGLIGRVFTSLAPAFPFEYSFLDESYGEQFRRDERLSGIFTTFSALAVGIAALGLFGLTSFQVLQRRKEVGVRKVLGASSLRLYGMFVRECLQWVVLANLIAWPLAYVGMTRWLAGFAYRTVMDIGLFIAAGMLALAIALLTVSVQVIRAARANPVDSLRYE